jgi:hypothetical protein
MGAELPQRAAPSATPIDALSAVSNTVATLVDQSQVFDGLVQQLVQQNEKLKADLLEAQRQIAELLGDDTNYPEDDNRAFGTHIRQAWSILRGK